MKKQIKVLTAAALLTLGASFSALAAETYTWAIEDGEWVCYDADGDRYTNEWVKSEGVEYYVDDDGNLVTSDWVDDGDGVYYVGSTGTKTKSDWRLVAPMDDEDAEEEWYWFGSSGKMVSDKKQVINGQTYYFGDDGAMLTGWVDYDSENGAAQATEMTGNTVYTDENGARVKNAWVKTYAPGVDEEDQDDADEYWYWIKSSGKVATGKQSNLNGQTYFFNEDGQMLSGWVAKSGTNYVEINHKDAPELETFAEGEVYFCGDSEDGHAKKNKWIKEYANNKYDADDSDNSTYWFWIQKDGTVFIPTSASDATEITFEDGEEKDALVEGDELKIEDKKINGEVYCFNENGQMQSGLIEVDEKIYYYGGGNDGAKKDGSQTIADEYGVEYKFYFDKDGAGVTGAKSGKLYNDGLLVTSGDAKYAVIDYVKAGYKFIVNKSGSIQTSEKVYKDGDDEIENTDGIDFNDGKVDSTLKGAYVK